MQTNASKNNANQPANDSREKRSPEQALSVGENTGAAGQLKAAQDMADNSPRANQLSQLKQIAGQSQPVAQLKTEIQHTTGAINVNGSDRMVGKAMTAKLDPMDAVKGSATGVNSAWMKWIRGQHYNANVVRGHLLNHDLGGFGIEENLYPISTKANADHSAKVEQNVKGELKDLYEKVTDKNEGYVHYKVDVAEKDAYKNAAFFCQWRVEHPLNTFTDIKKEIIPSDLGKDKGGFGGGKKSKQSPGLWQHGSSKGGKEVTSVKKRLDDAVDAGQISFTNKKSPDPFKTTKVDNVQDSVEWLNDYVDEHGYDKTLKLLENNLEKASKNEKRGFRYLIRQLKSMKNDD